MEIYYNNGKIVLVGPMGKLEIPYDDSDVIHITLKAHAEAIKEV